MDNFDSLVDDSATQQPYTQAPAQAQPNATAAMPQESPQDGSLNFDNLQDDSEKYGTLPEMAKSFGHSALKGATFGLGTAAELAAGRKPEDIEGGERENPIISAAGELTGLVASSMIPGIGEAGVLAKAGEAGAKMAGIAGAEGVMAKIGSTAVRSAVETAAYQGTDEVHKMILGDPDQTASTAMMDIGLAGVLGMAGGTVLGGAHELWKVGSQSKMAQALSTVADHMGGIEGQETSAVADKFASVGVDLSPTGRVIASQEPYFSEMAQELSQTATRTGTALREEAKDIHRQIGDNAVRSLGKDPSVLAKQAPLSEYEAGKEALTSAAKEFKTKLDPQVKEFEKIKEKYSDAMLQTQDHMSAQDSLLKLGQEQGWIGGENDIEKEFNRVVRKLPEQSSLADVSKLMTQIGDNTASNLPFGQATPLSRAGALMKRSLGEMQDNVAFRELGEKAPEMIESLKAAKAAYRDLAQLRDDLGGSLGIRSSVTKFPEALKAAASTDAEAMLRKLSTQKDAHLLDTFTKHFPETAALVKNYHIDRMIDKSVSGESVNYKTLFNHYNKMSPELQSFIMTPENAAKMATLQEVAGQLPKKLGPDTARLTDAMSHGPSALGAIVGAASGHGGIAAVIGMLGHHALREGTDASKLAFLKFMASSKPVNAEGYKQMVDFIHSTMKGEAALNKAAKNLFKPGAEVLNQSLRPTEGDRLKIHAAITSNDITPQKVLNSGSASAHYMPEATSAMIQQVANNVSLLKQGMPSANKKSMLDSKSVISKGQKAEYDNLLNLAQQPMTVIEKAKDGTLTVKDVQALNSLNPSALSSIRAKVTKELINASGDGVQIPYKTRMGLSMLLGHPVDSTFTPQGITGAQPQPDQAPMPAESGKTGAPASKTNKLSKMPSEYQTPGQTFSGRKTRD